MSNKFYQPGEQRAAKVGDLFATIAPRYDLINDLQSFGLHRRWKRILLAMADIKPGERALDLCCGTGDIAFALSGAGADVVGVDFSPAMLKVAEERAKACQEDAARRETSARPIDGEQIGSPSPLTLSPGERGVHRTSRPTEDNATARQEPRPTVQFISGDAMNISFPDNSFDVVTIGYGLRNLANWERGLEEMARVARPGGRLLVLDFGKPENPFWRGIYFAALKYLVPLFGRIFCRNSAAYAYIYESLRDYPAQQGVTAKMEALHCKDIEVRQLLGGAMSIHSARKRFD